MHITREVCLKINGISILKYSHDYHVKSPYMGRIYVHSSSRYTIRFLNCNSRSNIVFL